MKYLYVIAGVFFSAFAQMMLKKASFFELKSTAHTFYTGGSIASYIIAFIFYSIILRHYPISKISPAMTVLIMILVVFFGIFLGEKISFPQLIGIGMGIVSVFLILS